MLGLTAFVAILAFVYFTSVSAVERIGVLLESGQNTEFIKTELEGMFYGNGAMTIAFVFLLLFFMLIVADAILVKPLKRLAFIISTLDLEKPSSFPAPHGASPEELVVIFKSLEEMVASARQMHTRDAEISRTKSDFISTAAHQLRTPLTGIRWAIEALEKDPALPADKKQIVKDASEKSKQLVGVVKTLLDVSAIESGKYHYEFVPTDLLALAKGVMDSVSTMAKERGIIVSVTPPVDLPLALADKERIRWVVENLVENAVRYTPRGGSVSILFETAADRVFFYVRDTGIGIPPQDSVNIFERFYRGKSASTKENEGNGLGLYIARNIIRDHKGDLSFRSNQDGIGTTFFFSLPVATSPQGATLSS
jgi:signal transduction histidine kinase